MVSAKEAAEILAAVTASMPTVRGMQSRQRRAVPANEIVAAAIGRPDLDPKDAHDGARDVAEEKSHSGTTDEHGPGTPGFWTFWSQYAVYKIGQDLISKKLWVFALTAAVNLAPFIPNTQFGLIAKALLDTLSLGYIGATAWVDKSGNGSSTAAYERAAITTSKEG